MELGINLSPDLKQSLQLKIDQKLINKLNLLRMPYPGLLNKIKEEVEGNVVLGIDRKDRLVKFVKDKVYGGSKRELIERKDKQMESLSYDMKPTLEEHLLDQLSLEMLDDLSTNIGKELIANIDDDGYIRNYVALKEKIRKKYHVSSNRIGSVLKIIQSFEPVGVGSKNLKDCLLIQINEDDFQDEELKSSLNKLLKYFLPYLEERDFRAIRQKMNLDQKELDILISYLKGLDPFPGRQFSNKKAKEIILPSFEIKEENGGYKILNLEENHGPKLKLDEKYLIMLSNPKLEKGTKDYLKSKLKEAKQFIEDINNRKLMIEKLLKIIIRKQKSFLKKGVFWLKPLQQEEIARLFGIHPSTVSRAVRGKYIQTPHGVYPLNFLLPRNQKGHSSQQVKKMIEDIIKPKKSGHISDRAIADILNKEGVDIKRRTVAKYRGELAKYKDLV